MQKHSATSDVPALARLQQRGLLVGVVALAAGVIGAFINSDRFFQSWLIGFLFILGLSLGSLGLLMLQHLSGGKWGLAGRRVRSEEHTSELQSPCNIVCRLLLGKKK